MNFDPDSSPWNMPELEWYYGYPFALGVMAVVTAGMVWFFRSMGWIGRNKPPDRNGF
jgi:magnesium transporter